jgi:hypothetical protein
MDFSVRIEAGIQDGDVDGEVVLTQQSNAAKRSRLLPAAPNAPTAGVTVSDAGILRGPADGDDPPRRRTVEQIEEARRTIKETPRYKLARAVAGVIGRNPEDLLEKDQLLDSAVAETEDRLQPVQLRPSMWTPAHYSISLVFSKLQPRQLREYNDERDPDRKAELIKNACTAAVKETIRSRQGGVLAGPNNPGGDVTSEELATYLSGLSLVLSRINYSQDPLKVSDEDVAEMVRILHEQTVVSIGQLQDKEPINFVAYEALANGSNLAKAVAAIASNPLAVVVELKNWDRTNNDSRLAKTREIVSETNNSRTSRRVVDRFEVGTRGQPLNPSYGYPSRLASLPEFSMKVRFSAKLSAAVEQVLEHIRAILKLSWNEFGTRDPVEFHSKLASDSIKILFARYAAYLVRKAELSTRTRSEDRAAVVAVDYEITRVLCELQADASYSPGAGKRRKPYFYCKSEGDPRSSRVLASFGGADEGQEEDSDEGVSLAMYGEPLVDNGRRRQGSGGDAPTGAQMAQRIPQNYVFRRFVA